MANIKVRILFLLISYLVIGNSNIANADGKVFLKLHDDTWIVGKELAQRAVISHREGFQEMDISIDVETRGYSGLWLFPIPAKAGDISLDVKKGFNVPKGLLYSEYKEEILKTYCQGLVSISFSSLFGAVGRLFVFRALVSTFFGSEFIDDILTYYRKFSKLGLESEVIQARSIEDLFYFFSSRGLEVSDDDKSIWREYHESGYSFIVSRFKPENSEIKEKTLSLSLGFPVENGFFPLKPSKTCQVPRLSDSYSSIGIISIGR
jgi:hypothetical protein